jgi:glyoxalase family protein
LVLGLHHITAICGEPQRNLDFYAGILGLRLVKRTVNFDDPATYHLYYGDEVGTPGTLLTFFPWPGAPTGQIGSGQVAVTSFAIPARSLGFWLTRLVQSGIKFEGPTRRQEGVASPEQVIAFRDPDGLMLEIVAGAGTDPKPGWGGAAGVPAEHALRGLRRVTLWIDQADLTVRLLTEALGFRPITPETNPARYAAGGGGAGT